MRVIQLLLSTVMFAGLGACDAAEPGAGTLTREDARAILRDASQRAVGRTTTVVISYEWTLKEIIGVQIQANDFDGALETLKSYHDASGQYQILKELANALGTDGQLNAAFDVLNQHSDFKNHRSSLEDEVRLHWIDRLIIQDDLVAVTEQIAQLKTKPCVADALQKLETAHHKAGRDVLATEEFSLAINAAAESPCDMLKIAKAQLALGRIEAATEAIQRLVRSVEKSEVLTRVGGLAQSAVIVAKANDHVMARQFFEKAMENVKDVNDLNKTNAIAAIAKCQGTAGYFDDALKTLSMPGQNADSSGSEKDQAILTIAIAQFESGDADAAFRTAASIQRYPQYRDDAFQKFAELQIAKSEFDKAVVSAGKIENGSIRAAMLLKAAVALVNSGDAKNAANIADRIELSSKISFHGGGKFDFRDPQSWGRDYEPGFTFNSRHRSTERAAEVAAMAMTLSIKLGKPPTGSFATVFKKFDPEVIRSLARAHTANGNENDALTWSKELPTSKSDESEDESMQDWRQNRQIYALIGVAEGILDRTTPQIP